VSSITSTISIPAFQQLINPILDYVEAFATTIGLAQGQRAQLRLALEEVMTNVVAHGYADRPGEPLDLVIQATDEGLKILVREKGIPFAPEQLPRYDPGHAQERDQGLGCYLAEKMVDRLEYRNLGRDGLAIEMFKRFGADRIAVDLLGASSAAAHSAVVPLTAEDLIIRLFTAADAIEISKVAYKTYGYSYSSFVYHPDQIVEMNRDGRMVSLVAVDPANRLMGHICLKRFAANSRTGEAMALFVQPEHRRLGLALSLNLALKNTASGLGLESWYVHAVAGHSLSQGMRERLALHPCGIMLGALPRKLEFRQLTGVMKDKVSVLVMWGALKPRGLRPIFCPKRHAEKIEEIYRGLGLACPPGGEEAQPTQPAELHAEINEVFNVAELEIFGRAEEVEARLKRELRRLTLQRLDVIYAVIDLENSTAPKLCDLMESLGFFFSGVVPDALRGRDALVMQYLNNYAPDYDAIVLAAEDSRRLLAYVRACDPHGGEEWRL
jgi:anti-sigma regulatory factor (Ser/Thr protein kinase)